jgi:hypothetical protein
VRARARRARWTPPRSADVPDVHLWLEALADWLVCEQVTRVVMEATGQQLEARRYVLEEQGFELLLVHARHVKILPGRKTDLSCGLLAPWTGRYCAVGSSAVTEDNLTSDVRGSPGKTAVRMALT